MRKCYYFIVSVIIIMCFIGCSNTKNQVTQTNNTETTQALPTKKETLYETTVVTASETDKFEEYSQVYNLNSNDVDIVRTIYDELQNCLTLQNSATEQYTRKPVEINQLCIVYFGENPILVCYYPIEGKMITNSLEINENGTLTQTEFDMDAYTKANRNKRGFVDSSTITTAIPFGTRYGKENNIKWLCCAYSEYKEKRQEKYGDILESNESFLEDLNNNQKDMLTNILKYSDDWETYHNSWENKDYPCIYINIWSFGDGTAEILCTHGTIDFHNSKSTQYSGTNHGYSISKNGCTELDDSATERLERDLSEQDKLYWSNDWIEKTKEEKLAEYILEIDQS